MEQRHRVAVDPLGGLGAAAPDQLSAEELTRDRVPGDADGNRLRPGVVGLVVVWCGLAGDRGVSDRAGLVFLQAGAGGDQVEDLHDLGAEAAGEPCLAADRVLPGDPALLVGRRPEG